MMTTENQISQHKVGKENGSRGARRIFVQCQGVSFRERCRGGIYDASLSLFHLLACLLTGVINAAPTMPLRPPRPVQRGRQERAAVLRGSRPAEPDPAGRPAHAGRGAGRGEEPEAQALPVVLGRPRRHRGEPGVVAHLAGGHMGPPLQVLAMPD